MGQFIFAKTDIVDEFTYKCDEYYHPEDEGGVAWNDSSVGIVWPELNCEFCLSAKDPLLPFLSVDKNDSTK